MTQVTAAHITPECRRNKGDRSAWDEAANRLWHAYIEVVEGWRGEPHQPTLHLVLTLDRPGGEGTDGY